MQGINEPTTGIYILNKFPVLNANLADLTVFEVQRKPKSKTGEKPLELVPFLSLFLAGAEASPKDSAFTEFSSLTFAATSAYATTWTFVKQKAHTVDQAVSSSQ